MSLSPPMLLSFACLALLKATVKKAAQKLAAEPSS